MPGLRKIRLAEGVEIAALAATLVLTATLVAWWTILLRSLMDASLELQRAMLAADSALTAPQVALAQLEAVERHKRQLLMLVGESSLLALLLVAGLVVLFALARRRRRQRENMERLLQFTSHEFKTPVAGVKGLLQSLALGSVREDERRELIQLGLLECERLEHLAETVLAYQRAMSREPLEATRPLDAARFVGEVLEHHRRTRVGAEIHCGELTAVTVMADRDGLRVVLENLLDNAQKYGGGSVRIDAASIDGRWQLDIADRGEGFAAECAERLFELHHRSEAGGVTHGAGLGLAIARQLMRRMGGELTARSDGAGRGAVFSVHLLLAASPRATHG